MQKFIALLVLFFASGGAWSEWVRVGETADVVFYIDPTTVRKDGDLRKVWSIQDLKERHIDGDLSLRAREEFDCKQERSRLLSLTTHSGPMATGDTLWKTSEPREWNDVPPDTLLEKKLQIICAI